MKRMTFPLAAASMALTLTACGTNATQDQPKPVRQTATAYLDQDKDTAVKVTVDLTGGWSVQFARGAVYLYEGEAAEDAESTAMLITLDQDAYDGHLADAMEDEERKETAEGIYFTPYEGESSYLTTLDDSFIMVSAANMKELEAVVSRFELSSAY